ncbi:MAG: zinc protease [Arcticibacterium sp.]|jgi:zinc protease
MKKLAIIISFLIFSIVSYAQTAEEVIESYIGAVGGEANLLAIKSVKMSGQANASGMEFPMVILQKGKTQFKSYISFQGMDIVQPAAYDGEEVWSTNFMNMQNEVMEGEAAEAVKREAKDFPDPLLEYAKNGYSVELGEDATIDGLAHYSLSLVKPDQTIEGQEISGVTTFIIDKESHLVVQRIQKNAMGTIKTLMSNYSKVNDVLFPHTMKTEINGNMMSEVEIKSIEVNIPMDDLQFSFPD